MMREILDNEGNDQIEERPEEDESTFIETYVE